MSHLLSIEEICERSLRKIGAFAIRASGARPQEIAEARYWLDMVVGHEASRARTWWLVPSSATFNLTAGNGGPYDLTAALGSVQAPDGIQFAIGVVLFDSSLQQDIHELPLMRRQEWETRTIAPAVDLPATNEPYEVWDSTDVAVPPAPPGVPEFCYIDRQQKPSFSCYPAPSGMPPVGVRLLFQGFPSDFTKTAGLDKTYKFRTAWNLWIVTALAAQIANGPVRKLPADEVQDMKKETQQLRDELEAYENQEQASEPRLVSYYNGD